MGLPSLSTSRQAPRPTAPTAGIVVLLCLSLVAGAAAVPFFSRNSARSAPANHSSGSRPKHNLHNHAAGEGLEIRRQDQADQSSRSYPKRNLHNPTSGEGLLAAQSEKSRQEAEPKLRPDTARESPFGHEAVTLEPIQLDLPKPLVPEEHETCFKDLEGAVPMFELVVARFREPLDWLADVPSLWSITVYNKGGEEFPMPEVVGRSFKVVNLTNKGREAGTYAHHIVTRYTTLAEYTVFSQAEPFVHSASLIDLLRSPSLLSSVQSMSLTYLCDNGPFATPPEVYTKYRKHPWYRSERLSLRTMNSVYFHDDGTVGIMNNYLNHHELPKGTNIIAHHLDCMGLPGWVPHEQEVGSFAYGGIFGVHQSRLLQHPIEVYKNIKHASAEHDLNTYVQERSWIMMLGGHGFSDV